MAEAVLLSCGEKVLAADRSIVEMSTERVHWRPFAVSSAREAPMLTIRRCARVDGQVVEGPLGRCIIRREGEVLYVQVEEGPFLGELVLRLGWYLVTSQLGGLLIHAAGVGHGDAALIACGKSGDGKSTLSRLCRAGGLRLLTDEVVQVFPDGRVGGTPFRSDVDNVGSPGVVRARLLVALRKAEGERFEPLAPTEAARLAMAQCFAVEEVALPKVEVRRRLLAFLGHVELRTLAFRKSPDVADFVRGALGPSEALGA